MVYKTFLKGKQVKQYARVVMKSKNIIWKKLTRCAKDYLRDMNFDVPQIERSQPGGFLLKK